MLSGVMAEAEVTETGRQSTTDPDACDTGRNMLRNIPGCKLPWEQERVAQIRTGRAKGEAKPPQPGPGVPRRS